MKVVLIRVNKAKILVREKVISCIEKGAVAFVGIERDDDLTVLEEMAKKITHLRIFEDERGKLNFSLKDKNYPLLCISNFTLCANTKKGRRPSFEEAMQKEEALRFFEDFVMLLEAKGLEVKKGEFGEKMKIDLEADGPVNIILEIKNKNASHSF
jgi:D-tyrosyl-tRNA(Tyr) deacylase